MDWKTLKRKIYYKDGSLRDIQVWKTGVEDWRKWVALVNQCYTVEFVNGLTGRIEDQIDFDVVQGQWASEVTEWSRCRILVREFSINCHFFCSQDIENDIDPRQFQSSDDHAALLLYLQRVSAALHRPVQLTLENSPEHVLLTVIGELVL